jgi:SEC-C motif-containing protein
MANNAIQPCPCHSGKLYYDCCQPYHEGKWPENALLLMRSRYAAYALHLVDYIIETTHSRKRMALQAQDILEFCRTTQFVNLTIHAFVDGPNEAYVTFTAHLERNGTDVSFTEKSRFLKENGRWFYEI